MARARQMDDFMVGGSRGPSANRPDPNIGRRPGDPYIIAQDSRPVGKEGLTAREREQYDDFLKTSDFGYRGGLTPLTGDPRTALRNISKLDRMAFDQFRNLQGGGDYAPALRPGMRVPGGTVQRRETRNRGGLADFFGRGGFLGAIGEAIGGTAPKRIVRNVPDPSMTPSSYMAPESGIGALSRRNYRRDPAYRTLDRVSAPLMPSEPLIETMPVLGDTPEPFAKVTKNEPGLIEEPLIEIKRGATFDAPDRVTDNITNVFEDIPSGTVNIAMSSAQAAANAVEQEKARAAEAEQARRAALEALFTEAGLENMVGDGPVFELPPGTDPIDDFDMLTLGTTPLSTTNPTAPVYEEMVGATPEQSGTYIMGGQIAPTSKFRRAYTIQGTTPEELAGLRAMRDDDLMYDYNLSLPPLR